MRRIAWFYSGNALANMFGGLLAAGILGNLDGDMGLASWRWLFIIVSSPIHASPDRELTAVSVRRRV